MTTWCIAKRLPVLFLALSAMAWAWTDFGTVKDREGDALQITRSGESVLLYLSRRGAFPVGIEMDLRDAKKVTGWIDSACRLRKVKDAKFQKALDEGDGELRVSLAERKVTLRIYYDNRVETLIIDDSNRTRLQNLLTQASANVFRDKNNMKYAKVKIEATLPVSRP